jgi:putative ABC transport system permease protein
MELLRLAWRNIFRNRRRTFLTLGAVTFACAVLAFMNAFQQSTYRTAIEAATTIFQGHLQLQHPKYHDDPKSYRTVESAEKVRATVLELPQVKHAALRVESFALLSSENRSYGAQIVGVEPNVEPSVSSLPGTVRSGRFLNDSDTYSVVLGRALAHNLHVGVGDELTLLGQGSDGSMAAAILNVVGTFESGSNELDRHIAEIPLQTAQELFSLEDQANMVVLKVSKVEESENVLPEIQNALQREKFGEYAILTWDELNPGLREAIELDMVGGWLFFTSLILIVAFGVLNTFLMSLLERTREFGLLLSLGMTPGGLMKMVSIELSFLLLLGFVPGTILGSLVILYFSIYGLSVPGSEEINQLWNLPSSLHPEMNPVYLIAGPMVVIVVTFLLVLPFSLRLRKLEPVEALRAV